MTKRFRDPPIKPVDQRDIASQVCTIKELEAWTAYEIKGMSLRHTSYHLGISIEAVRDRLKRARQKINNYAQAEHLDTNTLGPLCALPNRSDPTTISLAVTLLIQRDGPICYLCRNPFGPEYLQVEHIIPRSRGGTDEAVNLALACGSCNARKGPQIVSLLVTSGRAVYHPAQVPS